MTAALIVLHVLVCVFLIAVVLLQRGKGAEIGAVFGGGGSSTVFGSRGAGNLLTKLTTASATIFMITSLALSMAWQGDTSDRLFEEEIEQPAPAATESLFEEIGTVPAAPESEPVAEATAPAEEPAEGAAPTEEPAPAP